MSEANRPDVLLAHPSGNQFFRHLARTLRDHGRLAEVCTCIDWNPRSALARRLPPGLAAELGRRSFSHSLEVPVATHGWREWARLIAGRARLSGLTRHETGALSVDAVYQDFDRWVGGKIHRRGGLGVIYAYEDAAVVAFQQASALGWQKVYDLPIAYWETSHRLLAEEAERWPEWEFTLESTRNSPTKLARKTTELALADVVVCPSAFVARSLEGATTPNQRILVAPFGSPAPGPAPRPPRLERPLRVLFAGSMSQRKGLADLFEAVRRLPRGLVELVVLGSPVADLEFYRRRGVEFTYERPRAHAAVLEFMRTCDVFCLPSIVEGRALVVQEAMSQGLPVIVTPNSGADDVVVDGQNGFVVPIRDAETLAARLSWCAEHRDALPDMGRAAQTAAAAVTWRNYGEKIVAGITAGASATPPSSPARTGQPPSS